MPDQTSLMVILGSVATVASLMGVVVLHKFLIRLKSVNYAGWAELGKPMLVNPENASEANHLFMFIMCGRFNQIRDHELTRLGRRLQLIGCVSLLSVALAFLLLRWG
jgi:hypothetical protein